MISCAAIQNRLLALAEPMAVPQELAVHLTGCAACTAVQARAIKLDFYLANLPAPSSEARKLQFLEDVSAEGPVIRTKPVLPSSHGSGQFRPVRFLQRTVPPKAWASLAAGVLVFSVGVWWLNRPVERPAVPELAQGPRHELLAKSVKYHVGLSNSRTATQRFDIFSDWAADVTNEARDVYKVASREQISKLAAMYESTVATGLMDQAKLMIEDAANPAQFAGAITKLAETATQAQELSQAAPPDAQAALKRIAASADKARTALRTIADKKGA